MLDDALVQLLMQLLSNEMQVSILVVLDDALVPHYGNSIIV